MSVIIKTTLIITIIASTSHVSQSAKILGFFPVPSISHQVVFRALMEELANRGHQITMVTTDPIEKPHSNITQIDLHDLSYDIMKRAYDRSFNFKLSAFYKVFIDTFDAELASPKVGELLNDTKAQFDLCFVECIGVPMYPIKDRFKCPLILMCSLSPSFYNWEALGNPTNPAFYPGPLAKDFGQLNFVERVEATTYDLYFR